MTARPHGKSRQKDFQWQVIEEISRLLASSANPIIETTAESLDLTVRTLQRQLARCDGACFRTLVNECRREQALELLKSGKYSIREVAAHLKYSDPAHFACAFRRWTKYSSTAYRRLNYATRR